jgi:hypothetical protein
LKNKFLTLLIILSSNIEAGETRRKIDSLTLHEYKVYLCNAFLVMKKFPKGHYHRDSLSFDREKRAFIKLTGSFNFKTFLKECKDRVKEQICKMPEVHNFGVLSDYYGYGYQDLNILFKTFKNSKEVAFELCGKKKDFHFPSTNQLKGYPTSTK